MTQKFAGPKKQTWATPRAFFNFVEAKLDLQLTLDVCAQEHNHKCEKYFTPEQDGLSQVWNGRVWCNPPYNKISPWVEKGLRHYLAKEVEALVYLLPARTGTEWFHLYQNHFNIGFIRGRVRFDKPVDCEKNDSGPAEDSLILWRRVGDEGDGIYFLDWKLEKLERDKQCSLFGEVSA